MSKISYNVKFLDDELLESIGNVTGQEIAISSPTKVEELVTSVRDIMSIPQYVVIKVKMHVVNENRHVRFENQNYKSPLVDGGKYDIICELFGSKFYTIFRHDCKQSFFGNKHIVIKLNQRYSSFNAICQ